VPQVPGDYNARKKGPYGSYAPEGESYRQLVAHMAKEKVLLDATLFVYYAYEKEAAGVPAVGSTDTAFGWAAAFTALAHKAGIRIAAGTDALLSEKKQEHDALPFLHTELEILVRHAGLTPLEAIVAATRNSAEAAGLLKEHGTLERGKIADLVILNADPLRDIRATRDIRMVIRAGQIVPTEED
jgi:imidazolonepropionase-like amidohydrolase